MSSTTRIQRLRSSASVQRKVGIGLRLIVAVFLIIFSIFPILWVISASLKCNGYPGYPNTDPFET